MTSLSRPFKLAIVAIIAIGVVFRFAHLDRKVYWHDEIYTSLRVSGYIGWQVSKASFNNQFLTAEDLQTYQRLNPELGIDDTLRSLMTHPEHPPLYYLLLRLWMDNFGSSVAVARSFSAVLSLVTFPLLYLLANELFLAPGVGWIAIALLAVSPVHVLYAQEARQYSLWTISILLSSLTLLRSTRLNRSDDWIVYSVATAFNLYTNLLSILITFSQQLWVVLAEGFRWSSRVKRSILAISFAGLAFAPWLGILIENWTYVRSVTSWSERSPHNFPIAKFWGKHLTRSFIDFDGKTWEFLPQGTVLYLLLALTIVATIYLVRHAPKRVWVFMLSLGIAVLPLMVPDVLFGGMRSKNTRYFMGVIIGFELIISYLIYGLLTAKVRWQPKLGSALFALLIALGIASCVQNAQAEAWWNKGWSAETMRAISQIQQASAPVIISHPSDTNFGDLVTFSHKVNPQTQFWLIRREHFPLVPDKIRELEGNRQIFLYNVAKELREDLKEDYRIQFLDNTRLASVQPLE